MRNRRVLIVCSAAAFACAVALAGWLGLRDRTLATVVEPAVPATAQDERHDPAPPPENVEVAEQSVREDEPSRQPLPPPTPVASRHAAAADQGVAGGVAGGLPGGVVGAVASEAFAYVAAPALAKRVSEPAVRGREEHELDTESYQPLQENGFRLVHANPLSTFSIDVDTASYSNTRRFLTRGQLPPPDAVRIEELINYFDYDYPQPTGDAPFSVSVDVAAAPWASEHRLVRIGLKGREVSRNALNGSNLVFLVDVSGSMQPPNKLPLLKEALSLLAGELTARDQVSIVVYAGASGLVLPPTPGSSLGEIRAALARLEAGGSTNGGEGLELAYRMARENFIPGGINRVILATDGDFNVGVTNQGQLLQLLEQEARNGIHLTALGFGMGNYEDDTLEWLADRGNGNYAYIDTLAEARKVLVDELSATLVTIAKDVKAQVEFNPAMVGAYRLIGYENRMLNTEDFNDDRKDAGEIGAGHTVTALYEIVPAGQDPGVPAVAPLKYQSPAPRTREAAEGELLTVKLRYKAPDEDTSRLLSFAVRDAGDALDAASDDFRFACAVAAFGMSLRDSPHRGTATLEMARKLGGAGIGADPSGYRAEFLTLVERAADARTHRVGG